MSRNHPPAPAHKTGQGSADHPRGTATAPAPHSPTPPRPPAAPKTAGTAGSWASTPAVRRVMQANRSRDTRPELAVRRALHAMGLRYRVARRPLPHLRRTADLVFGPAKIAVFIDGCFWHRCPDHYTPPATNQAYWKAKIDANAARDSHTTTALQATGWTVMRFWSHEDPRDIATRVATQVRSTQPAPAHTTRPGHDTQPTATSRRTAT
ncbi:very short patch repair endonuclease [Streptosporangium canum]|uniref:very short patch repair endonuclease n=1 Tax=Streptosporangium canum TaxID=324952 RepID=UPI003696BEC0